MPEVGQAYIDVVPNMDTFGRGLETGVQKTTSSLGSKILKFGAVASVGFAAVGAAAGAAFHAFEESNQVAKQTDAVLTSTGNAAHVSAEQVGELADALSAKTAIDDEVIQSGENMLLTFKNIRNEAGAGNDVFNQATKTLIDLSTAMGTEPKQAAIQLGKALNDPIKGITALTRVGVTFTDQQKDQITALVESGKTMEAQKIILHELNTEFGGSAEAQKTATAAMGVALGNLAEVVGGLLAPAFEFLAAKAQVAIAFIQENIPAALDAVKGAFGDVLAAVQPVVEFLGERLSAAFAALSKAFTEDILPGLAKLWAALKPIVTVVAAVVGVVLKLALEALPVAITILGKVIGVFLAVETAVARVIGAIVSFAGKVIAAVGKVWNFLKPFAEWIVGKWVAGWQLLGDVASGIWSGVSAAAQAAWNIARGILNVIIAGINRVHDALAFANPFGGAGWDRIEPLANGGIVTRPTLAMVGESGPEAVIPLGSASAMGGVTVVVNGWVGTDQDLAARFQDVLLQRKRRTGSLGLS